MTQMPDWTKFSDDPNHRASKDAVRAWLPTIRCIHDDLNILEFIENLVRGRDVLDIGIVSHSARYFDLDDWRHGRIAHLAKSCLGVDILEPLVQELKDRGFNVACVDATSQVDLGSRYEVVFIGDVVEHVNNACDLLAFGGRHLSEDGRLYVTTPNPFSRKFMRQFRRSNGAVVVNLDHVAWITPTQAMELARRAGLKLVAYHLVKNFSPLQRRIKRIAWQFEPVDYSFPDYLYEFSRA